MHVLRKVIRVVEMDNALFMGFHDILGKQETLCNILADLAGHIIPLHTVHNRIFIGVFLENLLIVALEQGKDLLVRGVGLADQFALVAVGDIIGRDLIGVLLHDLLF